MRLRVGLYRGFYSLVYIVHVSRFITDTYTSAVLVKQEVIQLGTVVFIESKNCSILSKAVQYHYSFL